MSAVVSHFVTVTLTLHALLGCCWHHAHESDATIAHVEAAHAEFAQGNDCHRHQAHELVEHGEHPPVSNDPIDHSPDGCDDKCQYVAVSRVQVDQLLDLSVLDILPAESLSASAIGVTALRYGPDDTSIDPRPLRLHLLHHLFLI